MYFGIARTSLKMTARRLSLPVTPFYSWFNNINSRLCFYYFSFSKMFLKSCFKTKRPNGSQGLIIERVEMRYVGIRIFLNNRPRENQSFVHINHLISFLFFCFKIKIQAFHIFCIILNKYELMYIRQYLVFQFPRGEVGLVGLVAWLISIVAEMGRVRENGESLCMETESLAPFPGKSSHQRPIFHAIKGRNSYLSFRPPSISSDPSRSCSCLDPWNAHGGSQTGRSSGRLWRSRGGTFTTRLHPLHW